MNFFAALILDVLFVMAFARHVHSNHDDIQDIPETYGP